MDIAEQAKAKREEAARARRWANMLSLESDKTQLLQHAAELDREAAELQRQAAAAPVPPSRTVTQMQQQTQQQRESGPPATDSKDEDHKP